MALWNSKRRVFLNHSSIDTFSPREFILVFILLAVAGCLSHLVQYGRSLALSVPLSWLVLFHSLKCEFIENMFWSPYQKSRRSFFSEYSPIYLRIFAINITYHHSLPLRNMERNVKTSVTVICFFWFKDVCTYPGSYIKSCVVNIASDEVTRCLPIAVDRLTNSPRLEYSGQQLGSISVLR